MKVVVLSGLRHVLRCVPLAMEVSLRIVKRDRKSGKLESDLMWKRFQEMGILK